MHYLSVATAGIMKGILVEEDAGPEILLVDDTPCHLELLRQFFLYMDQPVCCAHGGREALRLINERTFSIMITDLNMPGMDGIELTRKAREIAPDMVVILCTGSCLPDITETALKAGITAVVRKPLDMHDLLGQVEEAMRQVKISAGG